MEVITAWATKVYLLAMTLGGPGLFVVAVADSSFLSIPEGNDLLIVILSIGQSWSRMGYLVLMTIAGSVLGCTLLYFAGRKGGAFIQRMSKGKLLAAQAAYQKYGIWTLLVASLVPPPMPFKAVVLSAGVCRVPFADFFLAVLLGRSVRYFTWGVLAVLFGQAARDYMERNLTRVGTLLLGAAVLIALGCFLLRKKSGPLIVRDEKL
ncbi:MAG: VTT domain-containing protein [Acidobacteria bacterium]|nr:VTT domain-containing protein [Acidobacteriota bacterium]